MIQRFSSRRQPLDSSVIHERLTGAVSYDRIAGYFRSSLLEVAGEDLGNLNGKIRVVCNSGIDERDVVTAKAAQQALRKSWCGGEPEKLFGLFGQIPDILEDVWIDVANGEIDEAKKLIQSVHPKHPFDEKYNRVEDMDWDTCAVVLNEEGKKVFCLRSGRSDPNPPGKSVTGFEYFAWKMGPVPKTYLCRVFHCRRIAASPDLARPAG